MFPMQGVTGSIPGQGTEIPRATTKNKDKTHITPISWSETFPGSPHFYQPILHFLFPLIYCPILWIRWLSLLRYKLLGGHVLLGPSRLTESRAGTSVRDPVGGGSGEWSSENGSDYYKTRTTTKCVVSVKTRTRDPGEVRLSELQVVYLEDGDNEGICLRIK